MTGKVTRHIHDLKLNVNLSNFMMMGKVTQHIQDDILDEKRAGLLK